MKSRMRSGFRKIIHQIGNNSSNKKIYIEDYVMTYLKKSPSGEDNVKYGVLLGDVKRAKGNVYIFVKGMVEVRDVIENSIFLMMISGPEFTKI